MAKPMCSDCGKRPRAYRKLCNPCVRRWQRQGRELPPKVLVQEPWEVTAAAVMEGRTDDECWPWLKGLNSAGYGQCSSKTGFNTRYAHRAMYMYLTGDHDLDEFELDHLCHNEDRACLGGDKCPHRACCNPRHLDKVPGSINLARRKPEVFQARVEREREARTHCVNDHELTADNVYWNNGKRRCKQCRTNGDRRANARKKAESRRIRQAAVPWNIDTHCRNGHERTQNNTVLENGRRRCLTCREINARERADKKRARTA